MKLIDRESSYLNWTRCSIWKLKQNLDLIGLILESLYLSLFVPNVMMMTSFKVIYSQNSHELGALVNYLALVSWLLISYRRINFNVWALLIFGCIPLTYILGLLAKGKPTSICWSDSCEIGTIWEVCRLEAFSWLGANLRFLRGSLIWSGLTLMMGFIIVEWFI